MPLAAACAARAGVGGAWRRERCVMETTGFSTTLDTLPPSLRRARTALALVGATTIGLMLGSISVFATFMLFNFILHWRS
jgi:hypothetical protein